MKPVQVLWPVLDPDPVLDPEHAPVALDGLVEVAHDNSDLDGTATGELRDHGR
ncbi:MAG: hypothetical protein ACXVYM_00560 [Gaiellaceae bacterium]